MTAPQSFVLYLTSIQRCWSSDNIITVWRTQADLKNPGNEYAFYSGMAQLINALGDAPFNQAARLTLDTLGRLRTIEAVNQPKE